MTKRYDEKIGIAICTRIIEGETIREICKDPKLPSERTVYRWLACTPSFWQLYARAREAQMDRWCDEIIEIADDTSQDYFDRIGADGEVERVFDPESVQRSKLRIETRKWIMSKLAAKRYGARLDVAVNATVEIANVSDEELEARIKARLARLGIEVKRPLLLRHCAAKPGNEDGAA